MSSWTTRCNHLLHKTRAVGLDSYQLALDLVRKPAGESVRDVMMARRTSNAVAATWFKMDREVGLVQYWGFIGYLREKQVGQSWNPTVKRLLYGTTITESVKKKTTAKVAFMITSTQRTELSERLGYEADHIKRLKPVEASLILQHNVSPNEVDDKLVGLVQEYNDALARQHQEAKLEALRLETERLAEKEKPATPLERESAEEPTMMLDQSFQNVDVDILQSTLPSPDESLSSSNGTLWYEVVENNVSDGSCTAVALYQNDEEATLCLELKREFAQRHAREKDTSIATTYFIRKTIK